MLIKPKAVVNSASRNRQQRIAVLTHYACLFDCCVSGQTAKQVIDERVALEIRRYLADSSRSIAEVRAELGYDDSSNFSKFVRRHLGQTPADFRKQFA